MIENNQELNIFSRWAIGLLFIYHGLVPKILWLSPTEVNLVVASGMEAAAANVISPIAGAAEIILGIILITLRQRLFPVYLTSAALIGLLGYVAIFSPALLADAFNPVSTNLMGLAFCYLIIKSQKTTQQA